MKMNILPYLKVSVPGNETEIEVLSAILENWYSDIRVPLQFYWTPVLDIDGVETFRLLNSSYEKNMKLADTISNCFFPGENWEFTDSQLKAILVYCEHKIPTDLHHRRYLQWRDDIHTPLSTRWKPSSDLYKLANLPNKDEVLNRYKDRPALLELADLLQELYGPRKIIDI